jgi:hypothetical protein
VRWPVGAGVASHAGFVEHDNDDDDDDDDDGKTGRLRPLIARARAGR